MKRIFLSLLVAFLMLVTAYATNRISSLNVVGHTKIKAPGGELSLNSMSFNAFDQTLKGVFGTNQLNKATAHGGAGAADKIYIWDPSTPEYQMYAQDLDGVFYNLDDWRGTPATGKLMRAGTAFWISSASASGETNEITILGQAVNVATQSVDLVEGLNLVGYGFSSDVKLSDTDLVNDGAGLGNLRGGAGVADKAYFWTGSGFELYAPAEDGIWYDVRDWKGTPATKVIEMGEGFWYSRGSGRGALTWSETNKYLNNVK